MIKKIIFRVDSGTKIGIGHVMRCLNFCDYIKEHSRDKEIIFICRNHDGNIINKIINEYKVHVLPKGNDELWLGCNWQEDCIETINILKNYNIDLLVIDHYGIDYKWENQMKSYVKKIMVIDDIFNRRHECDILLDQNAYIENNYINLVNKSCKLFLGMEYVILNQEFRKNISSIQLKTKRINISLGGSDPNNMTRYIIEEIINNKNKMDGFDDIYFDIIVGPSYIYYNELQNLISEYKNIHLFKNLPMKDIIDLLNICNICICSTGTSVYERIYLKKKIIGITIADNQKNIAKILNNMNIIKYVDHNKNVNMIEIIEYINNGINIEEYDILGDKLGEIIKLI